MPKEIKRVPSWIKRPDFHDDIHIIQKNSREEDHSCSVDCFCEPELRHVNPDTHRAVYVHKSEEEMCQ